MVAVLILKSWQLNYLIALNAMSGSINLHETTIKLIFGQTIEYSNGDAVLLQVQIINKR